MVDFIAVSSSRGRRSMPGRVNVSSPSFGAWYDPSSWFSSSSSNIVSDTLIDRLGKLYDQIMIDRTALLRKKSLGLAEQGDYSRFDSIAENYNTLVRQVAQGFKNNKLAFGGKFDFIKTSSMQDFATMCCWTKQYTMQSASGLAGIGFHGFGEISWKYAAAAILVINPVVIPTAIIVAGLYKIVPQAWTALFDSTSGASANFAKDMLNEMTKDLAQKVKNGEMTPQEAFNAVALSQAQFNQTLQKLGLEPIGGEEGEGFLDKVSKVADKATTLLVVGGVLVGGVLIYNAVKHRRFLAKAAVAAATKNPMVMTQ